MHLHRIPTDELSWSDPDASGVQRKPVAPGALGAHDVQLVRLPAGGRLETPPGATAHESLVVEGDWQLPDGTLTHGGFARWPGSRPLENHSLQGCTLLVRSAPAAEPRAANLHAPADREFWLPGQGNLSVRPLYDVGTEHTALVHWPPGERFVPHRHFGGEEIFVLSGLFQDEHGQYPRGTWTLSPHLSRHHPFVEEETVLFVKTGHVLSMETPA